MIKNLKEELKSIVFSWNWVQNLFQEYSEIQTRDLRKATGIIIPAENRNVFIVRSEKLISRELLFDEKKDHVLNPFSECEIISDMRKDFYKQLDPFISVESSITDFYGSVLKIEAKIKVLRN